MTGRMSPETRCYVTVYLCLSSSEYTSISSHIWSSRYLPIFLFRDGSWILIRIVSLINLAMFCSSFPTMLKLTINIGLPVVLYWSQMGRETFICSLNLSENVLPDSLMYSFSQSTPPHLYLYINPLFWRIVSLSLGFIRRSLMFLSPLKCIWMWCLLQIFLKLSLCSPV